MSNQHITDTTNQYFHIMPNMADDDLDPYQYRLYGHYKRVCGDNGTCWQSTKTTAEITKMSVGKVASTRRELEELGYIHINEDGHTLQIKMCDVMPANTERFKKRSPHERDVHHMKQRRTRKEEKSKDSVATSATMETEQPEEATHHIEKPTTPAKEQPQPTRTKRGKDKAYSEACKFRSALSDNEQAIFDNVHFALMDAQYSLPRNEIDMTGNANHRRYQKSTYKIVHVLMTSGYDINADLIQAWAQWYKLTYPQAKMVKSIDKTCEHIDQFIQEHHAMQQRLVAQTKVAPAPPPPLTDEEKDAQRRARQQAKAELLGPTDFDFGTNEDKN